jgi:hypothetical protein
LIHYYRFYYNQLNYYQQCSVHFVNKLKNMLGKKTASNG